VIEIIHAHRKAPDPNVWQNTMEVGANRREPGSQEARLLTCSRIGYPGLSVHSLIRGAVHQLGRNAHLGIATALGTTYCINFVGNSQKWLQL
jgi:hypothetical protein